MKYLIVLIVCSLTLFYQGCSIPMSTEPTETALQSNSIDHTIVIACNDLYQITTTGGMYSYALFQKNGNIAKCEDKLTSQPKIKILDNEIICVIRQAGTGVGTQSGFYYNPESDIFSEVYQSILDQNKGLVAHATNDKIVVESIFKDKSFYQEIINFRKPFSQVVMPFIDAEFSEDGASIRIGYYSGPDYEEVSEMFTLKTD